MKNILVVVTVVVLVSSLSYSAVLNTPLNGLTARNLGSAGGFSLFDWSFNPAATSDIRDLELYLGVVGLYNNFDYERNSLLGGGNINAKNKLFILPNGGIAYAVNDDWKIFTALTTPYGQGADFSSIGFDGEVAFANLAIGTSYDLVEWLTLGASVKIIYTDIMLGLPLISNNAYLGRVETNTDGWGYGWQLGAVIKYDPFSVGLTYEPSVKVSLSGDTTFPIVTGIGSDNAHSYIYSPERWGIGFAWDIFDDLRWGTNYFYTDYSDNDIIGISHDVAPTNFLALGWESVHAVHTGIEYQCYDWLTLRSGGAWMSSGTPDHSPPSIPDGAGWAVSVGAGIAMTDNLSFDIGTGYFWADRNIEFAPTNIGAGEYDLEGFLGGVMMTYKW